MSTYSSTLAPIPPKGIPRRVALVTGSSSGIGVAIARQLGSMGFNIGLTRMPEENDVVVTALKMQLEEAYGVEAEIFITDFNDPDTACPKLISEHIARFGRIDVLANNAGWAAHAGKTFMQLNDDIADNESATHRILSKVRSGFAANFEAPLVLSWLAVNCFRKQPIPDPAGITAPKNADDPNLNAGFYTANWGIGRIINTTSVHAQSPLPKSSIYTSAKHALKGLTVFLANELGPEGITVNAVGPGLIATPQTEIDPNDVESSQQSKPLLPIPRAGRPSEAAAAVGFLASIGGRYTTGQSIYTDGGFLIVNPQMMGRMQ